MGSDGVLPLPVALELDGERVLANARLSEAFTDAFRRRIVGGLEGRVEIKTRLIDREGAVVGRGGRTCKLLYSLWDETLYVSIEDEGREGKTERMFTEIDPALELCGTLRGLPVALFGALALADGYRLAAEVVLNPVSEELIERSRQFMSNPRGGARGGPNAMLGAVARLVPGRSGALGATFEFLGPPMARPRMDALAGTRTPTRSEAPARGKGPAP